MRRNGGSVRLALLARSRHARSAARRGGPVHLTQATGATLMEVTRRQRSHRDRQGVRMLQRIWNRTEPGGAASARDFAAVSSHRHSADRDTFQPGRCCPPWIYADDQRKEVLTASITQSRIREATLSAGRLAQGELSTSDDHVPVDIADLLDRAALTRPRIYPDLDVAITVPVLSLHHH